MFSRVCTSVKPSESGASVFWIIKYLFSFFNRYRSVQIIYSCVNFGRLCPSKIGPFHLCFQICKHWVVHIFFCYSFNVHEILVMSSLSFVILVIWIFFSFVLSLAKGLSFFLKKKCIVCFFFSFQRTSFCFCWLFYIDFLFSFHWYSF